MRLTAPADGAARIPAGWARSPRVLGRYVRERRALTLEQAIHKMSDFPAARAGLADRGRLVVGAAADVTVFDAASVIDHATFEQPFQYATGVAAVMVNGVLALRDGERRAVAAGRALRPATARPGSRRIGG